MNFCDIRLLLQYIREKVYLVNISGIHVHRLFLSYHFIHEKVYLVNIVVFSIVLFHM